MLDKIMDFAVSAIEINETRTPRTIEIIGKKDKMKISIDIGNDLGAEMNLFINDIPFHTGEPVNDEIKDLINCLHVERYARKDLRRKKASLRNNKLWDSLG